MHMVYSLGRKVLLSIVLHRAGKGLPCLEGSASGEVAPRDVVGIAEINRCLAVLGD